MIIVKQSAATGEIHQKEIPIKLEDFLAWQNGTLIQNAAPYLSHSDREFLISGTTKEEWDALFGKKDE